MAMLVLEQIQSYADEYLRYLRDNVMLECLPRWHMMAEAWRGQNRHAPLYAVRAVKRTHVVTIEWMLIKYWTAPSTGRRCRTITSLPLGKRWAYDRSTFRLADDSQWELIESIEQEAGRLRLEMRQLLILHRQLLSLETLSPSRKR